MRQIVHPHTHTCRSTLQTRPSMLISSSISPSDSSFSRIFLSRGIWPFPRIWSTLEHTYTSTCKHQKTLMIRKRVDSWQKGWKIEIALINRSPLFPTKNVQACVSHVCFYPFLNVCLPLDMFTTDEYCVRKKVIFDISGAQTWTGFIENRKTESTAPGVQWLLSRLSSLSYQINVTWMRTNEKQRIGELTQLCFSLILHKHLVFHYLWA